MARYRVVLVQQVIEQAIVYVDANSEGEAEQQAVDQATTSAGRLDPIDWKFDETCGDIEAFAKLAEDAA